MAKGPKHEFILIYGFGGGGGGAALMDQITIFVVDGTCWLGVYAIWTWWNLSLALFPPPPPKFPWNFFFCLLIIIGKHTAKTLKLFLPSTGSVIMMLWAKGWGFCVCHDDFGFAGGFSIYIYIKLNESRRGVKSVV